MPALIVLQVISSVARLLEEALDVAVGVGLDQAVGARDCRPASARSSPWPCARGAAAARRSRSTCVSTSPLKTTTDSVS